MFDNSKHSEFLTVVFCFILALLGGTVKELSKDDEQFCLKVFAKNVFISGFCGIIIGLFAPDFEHKNWIMAAAGISGVAGIAFLDFCVDILQFIIKRLAGKEEA